MKIFNGFYELFEVAILATGVFALIILYTRIFGLRSFAKMTSIDFATTIAIGSMIASVILPSKVSVVGGCFGILMVYLLQWLTSFLKVKSDLLSETMENQPVIVMKDGEVSYGGHSWPRPHDLPTQILLRVMQFSIPNPWTLQ